MMLILHTNVTFVPKAQSEIIPHELHWTVGFQVLQIAQGQVRSLQDWQEPLCAESCSFKLC